MFEFWSSVEYGTFLKGLVRELGGASAANGESGKGESGKGEPAGPTFVPLTLRTLGGSPADGSELLATRFPLPATAQQRFAVTEADYRQARGAWARLRLRWRCYGAYPLQLRRRVRREPAPQALVVCTNTFYAPWVAMRAARKRGIPVVHWMFDLFPDVLILAGKVRRGSLADRMLRRWVHAMFDGAAANVFLGAHLLAFAESKFGPIPRAVVIPVGCDAAPFAGHEPQPRAAGEPLRVLYCGNFGRMHDVGTLVGAVAAGVPEGLELTFRGNGAGFQELVSHCGAAARGLVLGGSLPEAEWRETMLRAEVALVTMKPGAEGIVMPSKTYSAMAAGQAILAICPRESDLADTVLQHDCGWVVEPGDAAGLRAVLEALPGTADAVQTKRRNAWRAAREHYDQKVLARRWRELLGALEAPGAR